MLFRSYYSWCAPLTPHCNFMFSSYEMTMAANKWLVKHFSFLILMQAKDALRWFYEWKYDSLSGCHLATCFHCTLLQYIADMLMFRGSFEWREKLIGWHGTHMIEQQKTCWYGASYKLTFMILLYGLYEGEMRKQKKFLLLWLHLGEYGKKPSHTFHDISG